MYQQPALLPPSVNFLPLTPHWTSLGALWQARGPGVCCLLLFLCCLLLQNILAGLAMPRLVSLRSVIQIFPRSIATPFSLKPPPPAVKLHLGHTQSTQQALSSRRRSLKQLGIMLLPSGWDGCPLQYFTPGQDFVRFPLCFANIHLYTWVKHCFLSKEITQWQRPNLPLECLY